MNKKNDKRLCWNCEGNVSLHLSQCPYCGVDLSQAPRDEDVSPFARSFEQRQQAHESLGSPFQTSYQDQAIPTPPYASMQSYGVSDEEWDQALTEEEPPQTEEDASDHKKGEMIALLLLLPGVVFFLFGLILTLFSHDGVLTLQWNQSFAYFYFIGAIPLLMLGWRALR